MLQTDKAQAEQIKQEREIDLQQVATETIPQPKPSLTELVDPTTPHGENVRKYLSVKDRVNVACALSSNKLEFRIRCRFMLWEQRSSFGKMVVDAINDYKAQNLFTCFHPAYMARFIFQIAKQYKISFDRNMIDAMDISARQSYAKTKEHPMYQLFNFIETAAKYKMLNRYNMELAIKFLSVTPGTQCVELYQEINKMLCDLDKHNELPCILPKREDVVVAVTEKVIMTMLQAPIKEREAQIKAQIEEQKAKTNQNNNPPEKSEEPTSDAHKKQTCCVM